MEIEARYGEIEFSVYGEEGGKMVKVVANFQYLGLKIYQTDDDWPVVR